MMLRRGAGNGGAVAAQQPLRSALGDVGNKISSNAANIAAQNGKTVANAALLGKKDQITLKSNKMIAIETENLHQLNLNQNKYNKVEHKKLEASTQKMDISEDEKKLVIEEHLEECEKSDETMYSTSTNESSYELDIPDIDAADYENPQLAADYVKDIYKYLFQLERRFRISNNFLQGKIVTYKMRSVLIDWLIQVHQKFHLLQETLYLCVWIIDAYLQAENVPKMELQLVGVTAMFLASKYEEMYVPAIDDFVYMTDNTYTKSQIRQMEISILKTLGFLLCKPLPLHFLRRFSKAGQADPKQHTMAKFFMELALHDGEFSHMDPSYLAACSLYISFKILNGPEWNHILEFYACYSEKNLLPGVQKICKLIIKSMDPDYKYKAVTNKYAATKFMRISTQPELHSPQIRDFASMNVA